MNKYVVKLKKSSSLKTERRVRRTKHVYTVYMQNFTNNGLQPVVLWKSENENPNNMHSFSIHVYTNIM